MCQPRNRDEPECAATAFFRYFKVPCFESMTFKALTNPTPFILIHAIFQTVLVVYGYKGEGCFGVF